MKRTAIYVRVSTDSQKDGDSVPAQREALRKYIDDRPELTFAGEYIDDGISGINSRGKLKRCRWIGPKNGIIALWRRFWRLTLKVYTEH